MNTYAVAREVSEGGTYLDAGKRYEVSQDGDTIFRFLDDYGDEIIASWGGCAHLDGGNWHRVETDAEGWAEWKPSKNGEAPPDWQDGWEWGCYDDDGDFAVEESEVPPVWLTSIKYIYRPRTVAEPVQAECDHPNADDYRNRAERAEAEATELRDRVRKLEALICDGLLGDNA